MKCYCMRTSRRSGRCGTPHYSKCSIYLPVDVGKNRHALSHAIAHIVVPADEPFVFSVRPCRTLAPKWRTLLQCRRRRQYDTGLRCLCLRWRLCPHMSLDGIRITVGHSQLTVWANPSSANFLWLTADVKHVIVALSLPRERLVSASEECDVPNH